MREAIRAIVRFSWAMSVLLWKEFSHIFAPGDDKSASRLPSLVTGATTAGVNSRTAAHNPPKIPDYLPSASATRPSLDVSRFVVLGEGLAAGVGDFALSSESQVRSFPAQMARQMGVDFRQPLIQAPGIGDFPGFSRLGVRLPAPMQTTVLAEFPPQPVSNLAVPGYTLEDALSLRPLPPLVHRNNAKQTAANLMWGVLPIALGKASLPTQLEYAIERSPSFVIVELGYYEALDACVNENPGMLPPAKRFSDLLSSIISPLRQNGGEVLVVNIPNPFDTAYFSSVETAARLAKVPVSFLLEQYGIKADDLVTVYGLNEIAFQLFAKSVEPLPPYSTVTSGFAMQMQGRIEALNQILENLGAKAGAVTYDLAALFRRVAHQGCPAGNKVLNGEYLGGFYSLNGYYPGQTGQAVIANEILGIVNRLYGSSFPSVDVNTVLVSDPVAAYKQAGGPPWSTAELHQLCCEKRGRSFESFVLELGTRSRNRETFQSDWAPLVEAPAKLPLRLPPDLEQVLPLNKSASYFGDGISPVNARDPQGIRWGSTANWLFGGLAMVDSHLSGSMRIRFTTPVNHVTQFQVDFMGGFNGDDAVLVAPQFFKMPFQDNRVDAVPGTVSSGTLNLDTGEVTNLSFYARYSSGALLSLISVNPDFPKEPLNFPGKYGSAWARFEQRHDGKLDFSFYGSTYVPLGGNILWPLNFVGPSGQFATVPAAGTVMHPHLSLSTKEPEPAPEHHCPEFSFNSLQEFTLFAHNSAFGDAFHLSVPQLGGPAKGRSHILGRLQIQFGAKSGNSVPFAVCGLSPGGTLFPLAASPISEAFPGRLSAGPQGFNENLRFPLRTYPLDDLSIIDDPFDLCVGAIDLRTGKCLNDLLHRAFISQDLIFALLRIEQRTPKDSFFFRGPALLTQDVRRQNVFRFQGIVHVPYPQGFRFPLPDFATAFTVGDDSALDPFLWFHAIQSTEHKNLIKQGGEQRIRSSTGDEFSYEYLIPSDATAGHARFEYENHTQQGKFKMHSLAWVDFAHSGAGAGNEECDTVSFTGFGVWSKDGLDTLQQIAVQISTSAKGPYVGIQVASGDVSNVNTKPLDERTALP